MSEQVKKRIPFCPMLSMGIGDYKVCVQDDCAWYMSSTKTCAAYVIAHNNILEIKSKQGK
ncbi:MAG: hypothetical protein IJD57_01780 [Candidatus Gastranaerophilales bacterium]|nr:hypothetical protein [Candidatus Gastranaerophilales bacterium]